MENTELQEIQKYQDEASQLEESAAVISIKNDQELVIADDYLVTLKTRLGKFKEFFKPMVTAAFKAHQTVKGRENLVCKPLERASKLLSDRVSMYKWNQKVKREEAERKARELADAKERETKRKIQEKIDEENRKVREKEEAEERRKRAEQDRIRAEKDKARKIVMRKEEEARRLVEERRIEEERAASDEKKAFLAEKKEDVYVAPKSVAAPVKTNTSVRVIFEPEVVSFKLVPDHYKSVDLARIKRIKAADRMWECPGIKFTPRPVGSTRRTS